MRAERAAGLLVRVAWSAAPQVADEIELRLPAGSTIADAIAAWRARTAATMTADRVGIWGRLRPLSAQLEHGDRVEIYRPLVVDPMEARRARQRRQRGARAAATGNPKR